MELDEPDVYYIYSASGYGGGFTTGTGFAAPTPSHKRMSGIECSEDPDDHIYDCAPDLPPPPDLCPPPPPPPLSPCRSPTREMTETDPGRKVVTKAEAEFDYDADQEDEISFTEGDIILVLSEEVYDGWALGEIGGMQGVFPNNFVRFYEEEEVAPRSLPSPKSARRGATEAAPSGPPTGPPIGPPSRPPVGPPSGVPSGPPPSKPQTSTVQEHNCSEIERRDGVAAKAALLEEELQKSETDAGGTASLPRKMSPGLMKQAAADDNKPSAQLGFTAGELRRFAIEHKDEFKPSKKTGPNQKSAPAPPETVFSPADVQKISSSRRTDPAASRPLTYSSEVSDPVPPPTGPPLKRMSVAPTVEPPKPSTSPGVERKPLPDIPVAKPQTWDQSDPAVSEKSDTYMYMPLDSDVASLKNRIDVLEEANDELQKRVSELQENQGMIGSGGSSISSDEIATIVARLETAETMNTKTNKLLTVLQSDLDEEINTRKQLETDVSRLRRTVQLLQE